MPNATLQAPDLRALHDDELSGAWLHAPDDTAAHAILEEAARRDLHDRQAAKRDKLREEWHGYAYADYLAAEAECRGELVNREGVRAGVRDGFALWCGPASVAEKYATEELREWWLTHPRLTITEYLAQRARDARMARAEYRETRTTEGTDGRDGNGQGVDGDAAAGLRRGRAADPVRPGRDGQQHGRPGAGQVRHTGPVQRGGVTMTVMPAQAVRELAVRDGQVARRPQASPAVRSQGIAGDQLLDVMWLWFGKYVRFPSPAAHDLVVLWAAHTWFRGKDGKLVTRATPRLYVLSDKPGSGKSQVLEGLNLVCPLAFGLTLEPTGPGMVKALKNNETFLIDEGDILFGKGKRKEAVRAILNGGYTRNGTYLTAKGREPVYGPVAVAGLDVLEKDTGDALTALLTRGFRIRMRMAPDNDQPADMSEATEAEAEKLRGWLAMWALQQAGAVATAQPDVPAELTGRAAQISKPLLAVADAAGGDWPARARAACVELALSAGTVAEKEDEPLEDQFAAFAATLGAGLSFSGDDGEAGDWDDDGGDDDDEALPALWQPRAGRVELGPPVPEFDRAQGICERSSLGEALESAGLVHWQEQADGSWRAGSGEVSLTVTPVF